MSSLYRRTRPQGVTSDQCYASLSGIGPIRSLVNRPEIIKMFLTGKSVVVFTVNVFVCVFVTLFSAGVAQILNRLDRKTFNDADQRLFEVCF